MRTWLGGTAAVVAALLLAGPPLPADGGPEPEGRGAPDLRTASLTWRTRDAHSRALTGLRRGLVLAGFGEAPMERSAEGSEATARAALGEFRIDAVDVVFAVGDRAAALARDSVRDRPVVYLAVRAPAALDAASSGNLCGVRSDLPGARLLGELRRCAPSFRTVGVVMPREEPAAEESLTGLTEAMAALGEGYTVIAARPAGAEPATRAREALARLLPDVDLVFLPPGVEDGTARAVGDALSRRGLPLVGSDRSHLDAGCAVVIRPDLEAAGEQAAVLARALARGAAPTELPVRRPRRFLVEVSLPASRRLGFEVPMTVLATATHVVPGVRTRR